MSLNEAAESISKWAMQQPSIMRLWFFGSRVKGDVRPSSDLDVAIELVRPPVQGVDESGGTASWFMIEQVWREELSNIVGFTVDLQLYDSQLTLNVMQYVAKSGLLIYER